MKKKIVALLPMKANSERVKGKNFRNFNGKPLFRWMLDTLLEIKVVDEVIINTDARSKIEEASIYESSRIIIRDRNPELCGDFISMNRILADDLNNVDADIYLMTHTTNPLLSADVISKALEVFQKAQVANKIDSLFSVNMTQSRFYSADCKPVNHDPENLIRTQDLDPWYEENSNLYLFTKESFMKTKARIGKNPMMFEMPKYESIDIDTQEDWDFAELAGRYMIERKG
jgi:CMP-N-acetylneuraminic acid synthetase